jgi:hypothetical protein
MLGAKRGKRKMTPLDVEDKKAALDEKLRYGSGHINVAFGVDLFNEFWRRGYITNGRFHNVAFPNEPLTLPAYGIDVCALPNWDIPEDEFVVGMGGFDAART